MYSTSESPKTVKRCAVCGEQFEPRYAKQKCCGKACAKIQADKTRSERRAAARTYVCKYCGETYEAKKPDRNQFCCREHGWLYQKEHAIVPAPKPLPECRICGNTCPSHGVKYCGDECRKEANRRSTFEAAKAKHDETVNSRECRECGKVFTPEYGSKLRSFCTDKCRSKHGKRVSKSKRKARLRGALVADRIDPMFVLARDKWRCHICGCKTPKRLRGTYEPNAPEVDHVIPIALGGAHTYDNVRCICRECNGKKGASLGGQPSLFSTPGYA